MAIPTSFGVARGWPVITGQMLAAVVPPVPPVPDLLGASPIAVLGSSRNRQNAVAAGDNVFLKTGGMLEWLAAEDPRIGIVTYLDAAQIAPAPGPQNTKRLGGSIFSDDGNGFTSMLSRIPRLSATQYPLVVYALTSNSVQSTNPDGTPFSAANYWSIAMTQIEQLRAAGIKVIIESLAPRSFIEDPNLPAQWAGTASVGYVAYPVINGLASAYANARADVAYWDVTTPNVDGSGVPILGRTRDGTHYAPLGAGNAQVVANGRACLDKLMLPGTVYDFATGPEMLAPFAGSGGTVSGTGIGGTMPSGWALARDSVLTNGAVVASAETRGGVPGVLLTIDTTAMAAGDIEGVEISPIAKPAYAVADYYQGKLRVQASASDAWRATGGMTILDAGGRATGGFRPINAGETAVSSIAAGTPLPQPDKATNLLVRTAIFKPTTAGAGNIRVMVWWTKASGPLTIWLAAPSLRTTPDPFTLLSRPSATVAAITSAAAVSFPEEEPFTHRLTATVPGAWSITGADAGRFTIDGSYGTIAPLSGTLDFESPTDADADNVYRLNVTLTPYDRTKPAVTQALAITIVDVADGFSDSFTRADATNLGPDWTVFGATDQVGVSSNVVRIYGVTASAVASPQQGDTRQQTIKYTVRMSSSNNANACPLMLDHLNWTGVRHASTTTLAQVTMTGGGAATVGAVWSLYEPNAVGTQWQAQIILDAGGVWRMLVFQNGVQLPLLSGSDDVTALVTGPLAAARRSGIVPRNGTLIAYLDNWNARTAAPIVSKVGLRALGLAATAVSAASAQASGIAFTGKHPSSSVDYISMTGTGAGTVIADGSVLRITGGVAGDTYTVTVSESLPGAVNSGRLTVLPTVTLS